MSLAPSYGTSTSTLKQYQAAEKACNRFLAWVPNNADFTAKIPGLVVDGVCPKTVGEVPESVLISQQFYEGFVGWMENFATYNKSNDSYEWTTIRNYNRDVMHSAQRTLELGYTSAGKAVNPSITAFFQVLNPNIKGNPWLILMENSLKGRESEKEREGGVRPSLGPAAPPMSLSGLGDVCSVYQTVGTQDALLRVVSATLGFQNCDRAGEPHLMRWYLTAWDSTYNIPVHVVYMPKVGESKLAVSLPFNPRHPQAPFLDIFYNSGCLAATGYHNLPYSGDSDGPMFPTLENRADSTRCTFMANIL